MEDPLPDYPFDELKKHLKGDLFLMIPQEPFILPMHLLILRNP